MRSKIKIVKLLILSIFLLEFFLLIFTIYDGFVSKNAKEALPNINNPFHLYYIISSLVIFILLIIKLIYIKGERTKLYGKMKIFVALICWVSWALCLLGLLLMLTFNFMGGLFLMGIIFTIMDINDYFNPFGDSDDLF